MQVWAADTVGGWVAGAVAGMVSGSDESQRLLPWASPSKGTRQAMLTQDPPGHTYSGPARPYLLGTRQAILTQDRQAILTQDLPGASSIEIHKRPDMQKATCG